jgi:hypothetical protein
VAEVISRYILSIIGEFKACTAAHGTSLGLELTGEQPLRENAQVFELL